MNNKVINLALADLSITLKSLYTKIFIILTFIYSWVLMNAKPNCKPVYYIDSNYVILLIFIIIASSFVLGRDFKNNTYTYIFSGRYTRTEIILSKILTIVFLGGIIWLFELGLYLCVILKLNLSGVRMVAMDIFNMKLLNILIFYLIMSALIGSFCIFVTCVSFNIISSIFWGISLYCILNTMIYNFFFLIRNEIISEPKWAYLIRVLPQGVLSQWKGECSIQSICILVLYSLLNTLLAIFTINNKNIKE